MDPYACPLEPRPCSLNMGTWECPSLSETVDTRVSSLEAFFGVVGTNGKSDVLKVVSGVGVPRFGLSKVNFGRSFPACRRLLSQQQGAHCVACLGQSLGAGPLPDYCFCFRGLGIYWLHGGVSQNLGHRWRSFGFPGKHHATSCEEPHARTT